MTTVSWDISCFKKMMIKCKTMTVAVEELYTAVFNLCDIGASVLSFEQTDVLNT